MARPRRRIVLATIVGIMAIGIVSYLESENWFQPRATQKDVRRQIKDGLPMGSTVQQTIAFLAARGWVDPKNVFLYPNLGNGSSDGFEQQDPHGKTLTAAITDAYPGLIISGGIYMKFGFNDKGRLTRYRVDDKYTGP